MTESISDLAIPPVIAPGETEAAVTDQISALALREGTWRWWWIGFALSVALLVQGIFAACWAFAQGIRVWGNDWPVMWGFPIINYVWWIGIASGGTFISAFFFLVRVEWRTSLSRIAETLTVFAAACAGLYPIFHLGRPWLFYWLFPYPNTMGLWPQFRSPLFWDFAAIFAYVTASVLFWYFGLLPDLATLRDRASRRGTQVFYGVLALGFRGSGREWGHYRAVYAVLAAIMAPMVVSVHSIVGLDFAGALTTGWHSTQFPPFFVFGAVHSGFAAVLFLVLPLRRLLGLEPFITGRHVDVLGRLLLTTALCVGYSYIMDAFFAFYRGEAAERLWFLDRVSGVHASVYWATLVLNVALPQMLWWRSLRASQPLLMLVSAGVIAGMWLERYGIVVTSPQHDHIPSAWGAYAATVWDWSLFTGTVGLFFTGFLLCVRLLPVISIFELRELVRGQR
ncbi:Molybdopterin oxidoreductase [Rhodovastum atsumiense]|uniref:Hydrogenase n=1 Tax=Rhodovastum atsumiense TaxID=504468 RepID=A0A5M6IY84_9PROT|nr:NrfD/PsrC family molybdoenzyme membrane anchor subunit [Rhodovastum atsumiense]KAA5613241.1 hydrogenase [Rhodovastum atsumiense]CAH2600602.1 Molybdopterin oxidoreductase [Rhodovastum atsumiense]